MLIAGGGVALPTPVDGASEFRFDAQVLRRWNLDEAALPAGSTVLFRGQSFWERYETTIGLVVVSLLEAGLIVVLLLQWRRRRRAERSLTERLRFEEVLSGLYVRFVAPATADVEAESERSLAAVGEFLGRRPGHLVAHSEKTGFRGSAAGPDPAWIRARPWSRSCASRGRRCGCGAARS